MNKKIVTIFLVIFCLLSTLVVGIWGKVPDSSTRIAVESITILDPTKDNQECAINDNGDKVILLEKGTLTYQIVYSISPEEPTDKSVFFSIISGKDNATIDESGLITFIEKNGNTFGVTIEISSNLDDGKKDTVIIDFKGSGSQIMPDM